jgi:PAS domain-containing protein
MESMHSLLKRQVKRHFGDPSGIPAEWQAFINGVNDAYREFDADRAMLEHSLELSSQEMLDANSEMRAVFEAIPDLVFRLNHQGAILDVKAGATGDR